MPKIDLFNKLCDKLDNKNIDTFFSKVIESKHIVLMMHKNPDGDTMGASLTMQRLFNRINKKSIIISPNSFPSFLSWMPNSENIIIANNNIKQAKTEILKADLIICVDFNATHRVGCELEKLLTESKAFKLIIDHHLEPDSGFDMYFSTTNVSSTSEITYKIIKLSKYYSLFDYEMAQCIYVGIITDTGSLSYSCNLSSTYECLSELMKMNIDGEKIHRLIYDNYSENRLQLLGHSLSKKLVVLPEFYTSYITINSEELKKYNYQTGDSEGIVNFGLSIKNINFTALFIERENRIRISFRSKENFDVNQFARKHFIGGGHRNAAGADSFLTLNETIETFLEILKLYKDDLNF